MTDSLELTSSPSSDDGDTAESTNTFTGSTEASSPPAPRGRCGPRLTVTMPDLEVPPPRFARQVPPVDVALFDNPMRAVAQESANSASKALATAGSIIAMQKSAASGIAASGVAGVMASVMKDIERTNAARTAQLASLAVPSVPKGLFDGVATTVTSLSALQKQQQPWAAGIASVWKPPDLVAGLRVGPIFEAQRLIAADLGMVMPRVVRFAETAVRVFADVMAGVAAEAARYSAGLAQLGVRAAQSVREFCERVIVAVCAAQNAAMRGDVDGVVWFLRTFLDLPRVGWRDRVQAGMDVLVFLRIEEFGPSAAFELLTFIEAEINRHFRRGWRPLVDTELNHRRVVSLDQLPGRLGVSPEVVEGWAPTARSAEDRALVVLNQIQDDRLEAVLRDLSPTEFQIAWVKGSAPASWSDAAMICGQPRSEGERVRAKLARRAQQFTAITTGPALEISP